MIFAVDRRVKILDDGTKIYVMYAVTRQHYSAYFDYWKESAFTQEWDRDRQDHSAVKKMFRNEFPEIAEWLAAQGARTTYWIDPEIHDRPTMQISDKGGFYEYGIGFLPDDPVETAFVLRWM
jgi:hypothetical protein